MKLSSGIAPLPKLLKLGVALGLGPDGPAVSRTAPGRGAWVCSEDCLITAGRRKAFDRAWRSTVSTEAVAALRNVFRNVIINMEQLPDAGSVPCGTAPRKG